MQASNYHLVHANIATMRAPLDDPIMAGFVAWTDEIDSLAQKSPGFIAQPSLPDEGTVFKEQTLVNVSIWDSIESLMKFTYHGEHASALKRRREWFERRAGPNYVLYRIPAGKLQTEVEIKQRLAYLELHGPTPFAFTFKQHFTVQEMMEHKNG